MNGLTSILPYLLAAGLAATFGVLILGVAALVRGGKFNARYSNKLMRMRVLLQAITVALLAAVALIYGATH